MNAYVNSLAGYLLAQSWQIALLAAIVALITFALRNRSAHIRYLLWLIVLAKCIVPPIYSVPIPVLPDRPLVERMPPSAMPEVPVMDVAVRAAEPIEIEAVADPQESKLVLPGIKETAVLVWSLGAFLFLVWIGVKAVRYTLWLRNRRSPLPSHLRLILHESLKDLKLKNLPRIWLTQDIGQPFVWGLFRGSVYLPVDFLDFDSPERCRTILAHELSHVARFDAAINLLQVLAQAIYWFHPFVWWTNRRIRQEREKCCDEMAVVQLKALPEHYTNAIVDTLVAERRSARPIPSLAIVGSVKDIEERIRTMMKPGKRFYKRPSLIAVTLLLVLFLVTVPTALVLTAEAKEKTTANPSPAPTARDKAAATAALFRAIEDKNVEKMRLAINQGADLEAKNKHSIWLKGDIQSLGCTPLYVASGVPTDIDVRNDSIRLLLEAGANPNTRAPNGQIPLHLAACQGGILSVELLVSAGSYVNTADKKGRTPAIMAFEVGYLGTFDLIVARGATVSTDLMSAYKGNLSRVQGLIKNGKAQERLEQDLTLLHAAAAGGHIAIVDLLLTNGLDVRLKTQEGYTALHYAVAGNHPEVAELLLAKGADVNTEPGKQTPLHWAIGRQHKEMINWLLTKGANPNADGGDYWGTPLHWAVWWRDVETAVLLVSHGGDIHFRTQKYPYSPLFDTVVHGNPAMAEALVTKAGDTKAAKWAPLHAAAASGDRQAVEDLLAKGADVDAKSELGSSALHTAAVYGHKEIAELLIEKGADVNARAERSLWDEGMTALHGSCVKGQRGVAELLIARGADVNAKTKNGYTPLHIAATGGYRDVVELLIAKSADVNAKDSYGRPPLSLAKNRGHTEIVELLRKHGAKDKSSAGASNAKPTKSLHQAAADGDIEQVKLLIRNGADVNAKYGNGATPLHISVMNGKIETTNLLIQKGADVNAMARNANTPLHVAALKGDIKTANLLISKGADVNAKTKHGLTPISRALLSDGGGRLMVELLVSKGAKVAALHLAAHRGDIDKVRSSLEKGTKVDVRDTAGHTPLFYAASAGQMHVVEFLISKSADVNAKDNRGGETPLFYAGDVGWKNVVELLIAKGADVNARGMRRSSALTSAAWVGRIDVAELLIAKGADVNARDDLGYIPLHPAARNGLVEIVEMLISKGSDVDAKTGWGETPLHSATLGKVLPGVMPLYSATRDGKIRVVQILTANGADVNVIDKKFGHTPLQSAQKNGYTEIVELLRKHGAKE